MGRILGIWAMLSGENLNGDNGDNGCSQHHLKQRNSESHFEDCRIEK